MLERFICFCKKNNKYYYKVFIIGDNFGDKY